MVPGPGEHAPWKPRPTFTDVGLNLEGAKDKHWVHDSDTGKWHQIGDCGFFASKGVCAYGDKCRFLHRGNVEDRLRAMRVTNERPPSVVHWVAATVFRFHVQHARWEMVVHGQSDRHWDSIGWVKTRGRAIPNRDPRDAHADEKEFAFGLIRREHGNNAASALLSDGLFVGCYLEQYDFGYEGCSRGSCAVYAWVERPQAHELFEGLYHFGNEVGWQDASAFCSHGKRGKTTKFFMNVLDKELHLLD